MNPILKNLSSTSDITDLVIFLDDKHPEILKESVLSVEKEESFFLYFSYGIKQKYEKIKHLYDICKKYNYNLTNNLNNKNQQINDLEEMLKRNWYDSKFLIECLNEFSKEDRVQICINTDILKKSFENNNVTIINELSKYPEVWGNEKKNQMIKERHLSTLELSELFYKNTNQNNNEEFQKQCVEFLNKKIREIDKHNVDEKLKDIVKFLMDMSKKEEVFTKEFKEELVGISISSTYSKVTNGILKVLFNEKLSTYKPEKPLWMHFEKLQNKDILYQFLEKFNYKDFWEDKEGVKNYQIDYLEKGLNSMDVKLDLKPFGKDNRTARNIAISKIVFPAIKNYLIEEIDGKVGFTREILKKNSIFKGQVTITLPNNDKDIRKLLDQTIGYKEDNKLIVLKEVQFYIKNIKGFNKAFEKDLLTEEELTFMLENFNRYGFGKDILNLLKEKVIEKKLIINLEDSIFKNQLYGENKIFYEEINTVINYNKMQKKFENVTENKIKKGKI